MSQPRNFFEEWKQKRAQQSASPDAPETEAEPAVPAPAVSLQQIPEAFQWTEERDRAIQELLETTVPGTLPAVHKQLQSIRHALVGGNLPEQRARQLLAEVQAYLRKHLQAEAGKRPVDHEGVTRARQDKLNALHAWQQAAEALHEYVTKHEEVYLEVAAYAADQGSAFLAACRRLLLESEPEPPEE